VARFAEGLKAFPRKGTAWGEAEVYKMPVPKTRFSMIWKVYDSVGAVRVLKLVHHSQDMAEAADDAWYDLLN